MKFNLKIIKDLYQDVITNYSQNGKCSECGECCTNILPMTNQEVLTIKAYIKKNNIKRKEINIFAKKIVYMTCPFLDNTKSKGKCMIYPVRPAICRVFSCYEMPQDYKGDVELKPCDKLLVSETFKEELS